jgi:hypothetical protein
MTAILSKDTQLTDPTGAVWTIGPADQLIRNGQDTAGLGTQLRVVAGEVYALGIDGAWWLWSGTGWTPYGPEPDPTPLGSQLRLVNQAITQLVATFSKIEGLPQDAEYTRLANDNVNAAIEKLKYAMENIALARFYANLLAPAPA